VKRYRYGGFGEHDSETPEEDFGRTAWMYQDAKRYGWAAGSDREFSDAVLDGLGMDLDTEDLYPPPDHDYPRRT
jgi:hypothetical protein